VSDAPSRDPIDIRAILARIDRDLAENAKLLAEQQKLAAEQNKLVAEGRKFDRDRWIVPLTMAITVFGGVLAAVIARLPEILRALGWAAT
jgi:hypothetical protein